MNNPWMKKNPLLSLWLSSFHRSANVARGHALGTARRQSNALMAKGYDDMLRLWSGTWMLEPAPLRKRTRR